MKLPDEILHDATNKVIVKYDMIDDLNKYAEGNLYFRDEIFRFSSGGAGKGYGDKGHYKGYKVLNETRTGFTMFDYGWQVALAAQFPTKRWGIGIHPNGGNPKKTRGCFGIQFESLAENVKCFNLFRDWFENHTYLDVEVV